MKYVGYASTGRREVFLKKNGTWCPARLISADELMITENIVVALRSIAFAEYILPTQCVVEFDPKKFPRFS